MKTRECDACKTPTLIYPEEGEWPSHVFPLCVKCQKIQGREGRNLPDLLIIPGLRCFPLHLPRAVKSFQQ